MRSPARRSAASSAGVERVFSAAGKMHDDLRKSAKDDTLEHSLIAAFTTPIELPFLEILDIDTYRYLGGLKQISIA